jgi:hypothetical protein
MSGCSYCEDGEGAQLIAYAKRTNELMNQLLSNHNRRVEKGEDAGFSALSVVNALLMYQKQNTPQNDTQCSKPSSELVR